MPPGTIRPLGALAQGLTQFASRLYQAPPNTIRGVKESDWPSALQPVQPIAPQGSEPLGWNFWQGQNLTYTPRPDAEYSAAELKRLASYPLARICIDNVKDQLCRIPWKIQARTLPGETKRDWQQRQKGDNTLIALSKRWEYPNPEQSWPEWARGLIDDMLTIDAAAILLRRTFSGEIQELRVVPGDTITRYIDDYGYTPAPPSPAYAQLWEGIPRVNLTTAQLVYKPRNIVRRNTMSSQLYGMSPTEALAEEIKIGIERLRFVLLYYTEGSVPDALQVVPNGILPKQIREAQEWMNSDLAGDLARRRQHRLIQGFTEDGKDQVLFPKEKLLSDPFDDLHIRKICFGYGTSPQRLLKLLNRATAEQNQESAEEEGLRPWQDWLAGVVNYIIRQQMGFDGYEMAFDADVERDTLKRAQADEIYATKGIRTINDISDDHGWERRSEPEADQLGIVTAQGWVALGQTVQPSAGLQHVPRAGEPQNDPQKKKEPVAA